MRNSFISITVTLKLNNWQTHILFHRHDTVTQVYPILTTFLAVKLKQKRNQRKENTFSGFCAGKGKPRGFQFSEFVMYMDLPERHEMKGTYQSGVIEISLSVRVLGNHSCFRFSVFRKNNDIIGVHVITWNSR